MRNLHFPPALWGLPATERTFPICQLFFFFPAGHVAYHQRITGHERHLSERLRLLLPKFVETSRGTESNFT